MAQNPRTILVAAEPGEERGRLEALVAEVERTEPAHSRSSGA